MKTRWAILILFTLIMGCNGYTAGYYKAVDDNSHAWSAEGYWDGQAIYAKEQIKNIENYRNAVEMIDFLLLDNYPLISDQLVLKRIENDLGGVCE